MSVAAHELDVEAPRAAMSESSSSDEQEGSTAACVASVSAMAGAADDASVVVPKPVCRCLPFPRTGGYLGKHIWLCGSDDAHVWPFK